MVCTIRPWTMADAAAIASMLNNRKIQDNLRDGIAYPYTVRDAQSYLQTPYDKSRPPGGLLFTRFFFVCSK